MPFFIAHQQVVDILLEHSCSGIACGYARSHVYQLVRADFPGFYDSCIGTRGIKIDQILATDDANAFVAFVNYRDKGVLVLCERETNLHNGSVNLQRFNLSLY